MVTRSIGLLIGITVVETELDNWAYLSLQLQTAAFDDRRYEGG